MPLNDPLGSTASDVLAFNVAKEDEFINSTNDYYTDRFGVTRYTAQGLATLAGGGTIQVYQQFKGLTPQNFGAVADGVADDTSAMQSWANQSGLLPLPKGQYKITAPITFGSGSRIVGENAGRGTGSGGNLTSQATKGASIILMGADFVGSVGFLFKDDSDQAMYSTGINNIKFDCDGSNAHAIEFQKAYDSLEVANVNVVNLGDSASAIRIVPNPDVAANGISQTIFISNVMGIHKGVSATVSTFYFDQCQEMNLVGVKAFGGPQSAKPSAHCMEFVDCRGVNLVGCSSAHTTGAGVYVRSSTRASIGVSILGHTYENCDQAGLLVRGAASPNNIARVYQTNPRFQSPQTVAADIDGADNCVIDVEMRTAVLGASTNLNRVYSSNQTSSVTNNGTDNTVVTYKNSSNSQEIWNVGLDIPSLKVGGYSIKRNVEVVNVLGDKTLGLSDYNVEQKLASSTAQTLTIPTNATAALPIDATKVPLRRTGAGAATITAATGVTLNGVSGGSFTLDRYKACVLCKDGPDTWTVVGDNSVVS